MGISKWFKPGYEVYRATTTNQNGLANTEYALAFIFAARFRPLTGTEILANQKLGLKTTDRCYCKVFLFEQTDLIKAPDGKVYDVRYVKNPMNMNHHLEIDCEYDPNHQLITVEV